MQQEKAESFEQENLSGIPPENYDKFLKWRREKLSAKTRATMSPEEAEKMFLKDLEDGWQETKEAN